MPATRRQKHGKRCTKHHDIGVRDGVSMVHSDPPLYVVHDFASEEECQQLIERATLSLAPSQVYSTSSQLRTSSSCFLSRESCKNLVLRVAEMVQKEWTCFELVQVGRYLPSQFYREHYDSICPRTKLGRSFCKNGGNRIITALLYLNDVPAGGGTVFPRLDVRIQPERGKLLLFFPSFVDGSLDRRALHAAEEATQEKWVCQMWIRQHARVPP